MGGHRQLVLGGAAADGERDSIAPNPHLHSIESLVILVEELMVRLNVTATLALCFLAVPAAAQDRIELKPPFEGEIVLHGVKSRVNVRLHARSGDDSPVMDVLKNGYKVIVLGKEGNFYAIKPPQGSNGCWIHTGSVHVQGDRAQTSRDAVPVRLDSRMNAEVLATLPKGMEVEVHKTYLGWHQISAPPGVHYYVHARYVKKTGIIEPPLIPTHPNDVATDHPAKKMLEEAHAEMHRQLRRKHPDFRLAISLFNKIASDAPNEAIEHEARQWSAFLASMDQIVSRHRDDMSILTDTLDRFRRDFEATMQAAEKHKPPPAPKFLHYGYLDSTPKYLNQNGTWCLLDRLGGKRIAFIQTDEITVRRLWGKYRQFIKINGTVIRKDGGIDVIKLDQAHYADRAPAHDHE